MLASIIIINHNYQEFLAQAIDSALNQTYPNVEVIVIDDGSRDNSPHIIKRYGDRITPILKENTGHCACINLGFERSRGDVVIFLDADDVLFDVAVERHMARMRDPRVVKSCGYLQVIDSAGNPTGRLIPGRLSESGDYRSLTLKHGIMTYRSSYTSGNAWARHFLEQVLPLPADAPINNSIGPDGYLAAVDVLFGRIESIHEPVGQYRVHGRNNGPVSFRFDAAYMRNRLECRYQRIRYAEDTAKRLGLEINTRNFYKLNNWKLCLMRQMLVLMEHKDTPPSFMEFVASPFQRYREGFWKSLVLAWLFLLIRILPPPSSLRVARYLLTRRDNRGVGVSLAGPAHKQA